jgi:diaminohydroxyphosphoribosylaminopyrimidine deaminase/5-amino-6-(5-phosphoribosylamino)uracil reductase
MNGFIDIERQENEKGQFQITGTESQQLVHHWRHQESGILIGKNTLITDNPSLTVRNIAGTSPTRFVLDERDEINISDYKLGDDSANTFKIIGKSCKSAKNILNFIADKNIDSLIVEGGKQTLNTFIRANLWDEARILIGPEEIKKGITAPNLDKKPFKSFSVGLDLIEFYRND